MRVAGEGLGLLVALTIFAPPAAASDPPDQDAATLERAAHLRQDGRCGEALPILEKLLARQLELRPPHAQDEGILLQQLLRERRLRAQGLITYDNDFRHTAQWEIGLCKFALRDYSGALVAFRQSRAYPFGSFCGNADREWEYRHGLYEGLALEHLGRAAEAVAPYADAANYSSDGGQDAENRLFALYLVAGQIEDLRRIAADGPRGRPVPGVAHRFRILDLERAHDWPALLNERRSHFRHGELVNEAIARHGDETAPLLLSELDKTSYFDRSLWRTLGRSVTPRTTTAIVERARHEQRLAALRDLVQGLREAGSAGQAAIVELQKGANATLRTALESKAHEPPARPREPVAFPPLPTSVRLPTSLPPEAAASAGAPPRR